MYLILYNILQINYIIIEVREAHVNLVQVSNQTSFLILSFRSQKYNYFY